MEKPVLKKEHFKMSSVLDWVLMLLIFAVLTLIINAFSYGNSIIESIPGMLILIAITLVGLLMSKIIPLKVPAIFYISIIALVISLPVFGSVAEYIYVSTSKISTLALCTVILAYSGVAIGKSWAEFRKMGWKGIVVTLCVILGTFLGSAVVAQIVLKMQGII